MNNPDEDGVANWIKLAAQAAPDPDKDHVAREDSCQTWLKDANLQANTVGAGKFWQTTLNPLNDGYKNVSGLYQQQFQDCLKYDPNAKGRIEAKAGTKGQPRANTEPALLASGFNGEPVAPVEDPVKIITFGEQKFYKLKYKDHNNNEVLVIDVVPAGEPNKYLKKDDSSVGFAVDPATKEVYKLDLDNSKVQNR